MPERRIATVLLLAVFLTAPAHLCAEIPLAPPGTLVDPDVEPPEDPAVAAAEQDIEIERAVSDEALEQTVQSLLARYPGVVRADVYVNDGVVELEGHVRDELVRERVTQFVRRIEGTRLVLNRMRTDEQVLSSWELFRVRLNQYGAGIARYWLRALGGLLIFVLALAVASVASRPIEHILAAAVSRELLRSMIQSLISGAIILAGLLVALSFMGLTELVLSIAGIAGIIGLTLGFAFRDIGENFIASIFLGLRRPFRVGDVIEVAGKRGVVRAMNMRATILDTFEGTHIRVPNGIVFKEILTNFTSAGKVRTDIELLVPFPVSSSKVIDAMRGAFADHPLVHADPPGRVFIQHISPEGVMMHAFFWHNAEINPILLRGEVLLRIKVAFQKDGIAPPPPEFVVTNRDAPAQQPAATGVSEVVEADTSLAAALENSSQGSPQTIKAAAAPGSEENVEEGANLLKKE